MKKIITVSILALMLSVFTGCMKKQEQAKVQTTAGDTAPQGGLVVRENNTLLGWLKRGKGVECTVTNPDGSTMTIQTKNNKIRMSGVPYVSVANPGAPEEGGVTVSDDEWMYSWGKSDGMKMNLKRVQELTAELGDDAPTDEPKTWEDMVHGWEDAGVDYNCQEKTLADSLFTPPADINFTDYTQYMEDMADMGKQLQDYTKGDNLDMDALEQKAKEMQDKYNIEN